MAATFTVSRYEKSKLDTTTKKVKGAMQEETNIEVLRQLKILNYNVIMMTETLKKKR